MRTVLAVFCALGILNLSMEAKKKMPASQTTEMSKQHKAAVKKIIKSRKAPKHRQKVN